MVITKIGRKKLGGHDACLGDTVRNFAKMGVFAYFLRGAWGEFYKSLWCSTRYLFISEIFPDAGNVRRASFRENERQSFENYRLCMEKRSFQT